MKRIAAAALLLSCLIGAAACGRIVPGGTEPTASPEPGSTEDGWWPRERWRT